MPARRRPRPSPPPDIDPQQVLDHPLFRAVLETLQDQRRNMVELAREVERLKALTPGPHSATPDSRNRDAGLVTSKPRRGPALKSKGPVATAARAAGVAMHEIARRMGVSYELVKKWDQRKSVPEQYRKSLADASKRKA